MTPTLVSSRDRLIQLVLDSVVSPHSKRAYQRSLSEFLTWCEQLRLPFTKATVNAYRVHLLENRKLAPASVNLRIVTVRRLAQEAVDNGMLAHEIGQGIQHIRGIKREGVRTGNWLTLEQAETLLAAPDSSLRGKRDRAILAVLIGCGLRRQETSNLTPNHIQLRDARWVIVDINGKGNRVRSVPMPSWCKAAIDVWVEEAQNSDHFPADGRLFRSISRADSKVFTKMMQAQSIFDVVKKYAEEAGIEHLSPHDLRRTFAKLAHKGHAALEQIQLSLGHASIQTTERYLGIRQDLTDAPCDRLGIRLENTEPCRDIPEPTQQRRA